VGAKREESSAALSSPAHRDDIAADNKTTNRTCSRRFIENTGMEERPFLCTDGYANLKQ
jgi:hypothetical protein